MVRWVSSHDSFFCMCRRGDPLITAAPRPIHKFVERSLNNRLPKNRSHAGADGCRMIWVYAAIKQEERIRADGIKRAQNRSDIARVLRRDNCRAKP